VTCGKQKKNKTKIAIARHTPASLQTAALVPNQRDNNVEELEELNEPVELELLGELEGLDGLDKLNRAEEDDNGEDAGSDTELDQKTDNEPEAAA
jgi:hypothetical protein